MDIHHKKKIFKRKGATGFIRIIVFSIQWPKTSGVNGGKYLQAYDGIHEFCCFLVSIGHLAACLTGKYEKCTDG